MSIIQQLPADIQSNPSAIENHYLYLQYHPILNDLCYKLFSNPKSIVTPFQTPPSREIFIIIRHLDQLLHKTNEGLHKSILILDLLTLKLCEFYLLGLDTKFEICSNCSCFSINYNSFTICGCDQDFIEEIKLFKKWFEYKVQLELEMEKNYKMIQEKDEILKLQENQKYMEEEKKRKNLEKKLNEEKMRNEYMEKHPPFKIWDKVEMMLKSYLNNKKARLHELRVLYDCENHKNIWDRMDELHEFIISKSEFGKKTLNKNLKHDGKPSCFFVVGDTASIGSNSIQLKSENSIVVLYELIISH